MSDSKISISTNRLQVRFGDEEALRIAAEAGFDGVDLSLEGHAKGVLPDIYAMDDRQLTEYFTGIRNRADELGIAVAQTHNLCGAYTPDEEYNQRVLFPRAERALKAASILGCEYSVVHCISTYQWGWAVPDSKMHEANQKMYAQLIPYAEKYGVKIALESFGGVKVGGVFGYDHFTDQNKMMREYEDLDTENKAFCFDSGHTNTGASGGFIDPAGFVRMFGERIKLLHLQDNTGGYDQHVFPRMGLIKWPEVFDALDEIGYDGYYNYELNLPFGGKMEAAVRFLGEYLRYFTDTKGRLD